MQHTVPTVQGTAHPTARSLMMRAGRRALKQLVTGGVQEGGSNRGLVMALSACGTFMVFASMVATGRVLVRHLINKRVEEYIQSRA